MHHRCHSSKQLVPTVSMCQALSSMISCFLNASITRRICFAVHLAFLYHGTIVCHHFTIFCAMPEPFQETLLTPNCCWQVFAVPVNRRPLFPGSIFPVQVKNRKLVQELMQFRRDGCVPDHFLLPCQACRSLQAVLSTWPDEEQWPACTKAFSWGDTIPASDFVLL